MMLLEEYDAEQVLKYREKETEDRTFARYEKLLSNNFIDFLLKIRYTTHTYKYYLRIEWRYVFGKTETA